MKISCLKPQVITVFNAVTGVRCQCVFAVVNLSILLLIVALQQHNLLHGTILTTECHLPSLHHPPSPTTFQYQTSGLIIDGDVWWCLVMLVVPGCDFCRWRLGWSWLGGTGGAQRKPQPAPSADQTSQSQRGWEWGLSCVAELHSTPPHCRHVRQAQEIRGGGGVLHPRPGRQKLQTWWVVRSDLLVLNSAQAEETTRLWPSFTYRNQ